MGGLDQLNLILFPSLQKVPHLVYVRGKNLKNPAECSTWKDKKWMKYLSSYLVVERVYSSSLARLAGLGKYLHFSLKL